MDFISIEEDIAPFHLVIDILIFLLGIFTVVKLKRTYLGGKLGKAMAFIAIGVFVMALNHIAGLVIDFEKIFHESDHVVDFIGLVLIFIGYYKVGKTFA